MRVAIYYAPASDDLLATAAARWLGRDAETNEACAQPDVPDIAALTVDPRGYGFHATLKPPMRLADGKNFAALRDATESLADRIVPFDLPPLAVSDVHGFLALRETVASAPLQALADICVTGLDSFRAPPTEVEVARRRRAKLDPAQEEMLVRWGYPYVLGTWFFHMTLTRRLNAEEKAAVMPRAITYFAEAVQITRRVTNICLFVQPEPGAPFTIAARLPLRGAAT